MQESLFDTDPPGPPAGTPSPVGSEITYGKLKGQPLDLLLMQPDYAIWLLTAKYAMLRKSHPQLLTWLLKRFGAPETTPEHNILQNRFLDERFCLQLLVHLHPELTQALPALVGPQNTEAALRRALWKRYAEAFQYRSLNADHNFDAPPTQQDQETRAAEIRRARKRLAELSLKVPRSRKATTPDLEHFGLADTTPTELLVWEPVVALRPAKFEVDGADVDYVARASLYLGSGIKGAWGEETLEVLNYEFIRVLRIEVKPFIGDDYPVVLRAMVAKKCNVLLVEQFEAAGASWENVVKVFASRDIRAVLLEEVLLTPVPDCVARLPLRPLDSAKADAMAEAVFDEFYASWLQAEQRKMTARSAALLAARDKLKTGP